MRSAGQLIGVKCWGPPYSHTSATVDSVHLWRWCTCNTLTETETTMQATSRAHMTYLIPVSISFTAWRFTARVTPAQHLKRNA